MPGLREGFTPAEKNTGRDYELGRKWKLGMWSGGEAKAPEIRLSKGKVKPEQLGQAAFELAKNDSVFRLGPTPEAKDLPTILKTLAPQLGQDIAVSDGAGWHGEGYTFTDSKGGEIFLTTHPEGGYRVDSARAGTEGTLVYQAIYAWAHNNDVQVHGDLGMTDLGTYRRNAQMISSILRFGTSKHLTVGPASGLADSWIRNDSSRAAAEYNLGLLLQREKELVFQRLPELAKMRYDSKENSFYDGEHRIPSEEVETYFEGRIAQLDTEISARVGHSTARRALAVAAAEGGGPGWRGWLVGDTAGAQRSFKGIFYSKDAGGALGAGGESAGVSGEAGGGGGKESLGGHESVESTSRRTADGEGAAEIARTVARDSIGRLRKFGIQTIEETSGGSPAISYDADGTISFRYDPREVEEFERLAAKGGAAVGESSKLRFGEELIHAAHLLSLKKAWQGSSEGIGFDVYVKNENEAVFDDIRKTVESAPVAIRPLLEKAIRDSHRVYGSEFRMGGKQVKADAETIFSDIENPVAFVGEFLRQAVQLKREGRLQEESHLYIVRLIGKLRPWVKAAIANVRKFLPGVERGEFGLRAKEALQRLEATYDEIQQGESADSLSGP